MDKRSILAYIMIGAVLITFFTLNQPTPEEIERQKAQQTLQAQQKEQQQLLQEEQARTAQENENRLKNDSAGIYFNVLNGSEEIVTLANKNISIDISTHGARIARAMLNDYNDQQGNSLTLFDSKDKLNVTDANREENGPNMLDCEFEFKQGLENINTSECYFAVQEKSDSTATLRLDFNEDRYIDFVYSLNGDSYMVNLSIVAHNMSSLLSTKDNISIDWVQLLRQHEPGYDFEQRYTNITYKPVDDDSDYLSEMQNDSEKFTQPMSWIAYKNQFFSCIMIAGDRFNDVSLKSDIVKKGQNILKSCQAEMTTGFDPSGAAPTQLQFYFGPNQFGTLQSSNDLAINQNDDIELEEIIYFGWPIVRWINRYFIMYLFDALSSFGLNMGIVLILLTLIVKAIVYPFTKKSYISSAKMRALKPHIDAINAKYTKKEDALKKQQEIMGLYTKYGASPMGGCLPMLIQMPVFIALFNFVPNAIALRQQSFLWAHDLSAFDSIISWEQPIWLIGDHISLFCLLFCVTQILNTYYTSKMQPNMGNPEMEQQQKIMKWMMYFMPIMFFFIFNDYSSGLNFYYFLSTLISVLIFIYLRRVVKEDELLKKMEAYAESNKNNPAKRSNMMSRLEALQEQQKKMIEERERLKNERKNRNR